MRENYHHLFGKWRTGVYSTYKHVSNDKVLRAITEGNCFITNGPAVNLEAHIDGIWRYMGSRCKDISELKISACTTEEFGSLKRIMLEVGVKPIDATISWENIYAQNKKIIDPTANRYFFVNNPILLKVNGIKEPIITKLPLHPYYPERGVKEIHIRPSKDSVQLLISKDYLHFLKVGKILRLIELFNIEIINNSIKVSIKYNIKITR